MYKNIINYVLYSGSEVTLVYIVSVLIGIIPITLFIYFWVLVSRFYQEIKNEENELVTFAKQNTNTRIINKFMTKDEYELSKRNLKINARGVKENKTLNRYIIKCEKWNRKYRLQRIEEYNNQYVI